jgi:hypothetical protein
MCACKHACVGVRALALAYVQDQLPRRGRREQAAGEEVHDLRLPHAEEKADYMGEILEEG